MAKIEPWRCDSCAVQARIDAQNGEPSVCEWFMRNCVCGNKQVEECTEYESIEEVK